VSTFVSAGLNDVGAVAMTATLRAGGYAVLTGDGRRLATVATITGHNSTFSRAAIDRRGEVFFQSTSRGVEALLRGFQGRLSTVIDNSGPFDLLAGGPIVDARGTVTFFGTLRGAAGVYSLAGGKLTKIVEDPRL